ncbi:MAG: thioredoxin [Desulfuromonas sp.]|uniref:TlpA disulfide reductase family protein n=1 Tax=Desulfuromonas sp. TaxID=892 RepID=UPI000CC5A278|nr:TlpA disulfide reductase family protein [Desulfuromonas sp.]PLX86037.1 MAG: thioredoxin [Desulfuromonas sp.]
MRRTLFLLVILLLLGGSLYWVFAAGSRPKEQAAQPAQSQALAPDFTLKDVQGQDVTLSQFRGKVVILNFWATWCPPCKAEMPSMDRLNEIFDGQDFVMLAVNVEEGDGGPVKAFLKSNPHSFTVLLDPAAKAQNLFKVYRFPETFIIGKDGAVVDRVIGAIDWAEPETVRYIRALVEK